MKSFRKKITNWKNEPTFEDLKSDFDEAEVFRQEIIEKINSYRETIEGGKSLPESLKKRGKSTIRPKVLRKLGEWVYPKLEEPFLSSHKLFSIEPRGANDAEQAMMNDMLLNWFWDVKINKIKFMNDLSRTVYDDGTVIVKDGWFTDIEIDNKIIKEPVYATPEQSYALLQRAVESGKIDPAKAQAIIETGEPMVIGYEEKVAIIEKVKENKPTVEVVDNLSVIVDPTCNGDIEKAKFIIHEYDIDYNTLKKNEYAENKIKKDGVDIIERHGYYHNIEEVNWDTAKEQNDYTEYDNYTESSKQFNFKDKTRKKKKAYEYWGYWDTNNDGNLEPIVATWVDNVLIRLELNPFPHKELPFSIATYLPRPKHVFGQSDSELLKENQDTIGIYTRAMHDQTITNSLGQTLYSNDLFASVSQKQMWEKGLNAATKPGIDPSRAIYKTKIEPIDSSIMNMIHFQIQDAESASGEKIFGNGINGESLGKSVGGIQSAMTASAQRRLGVLKRISEGILKRVAKHMLINAKSFLEDEVVIKLSDGMFKDIKRDDLIVDFDLKINIDTPEKRQDMSSKIAFLLQTTAQNMPFDITKELLSKWSYLNDMPDMAKKIIQIEPPAQSQEQIELERLQLENAKLMNQKLKSEIEETNAKRDRLDAHTYEAIGRMDDNAAKVKKMEADAELKQAQAEKIKKELNVKTDKKETLSKQEEEARKAILQNIIENNKEERIRYDY